MRYTRSIPATLLLAGLLAACSPGTSAPTADAEPGAADSEAPAEAVDTVSLWYLSDAVGVEEAIARFEQANPGITVDAQPYANDQYKTKLKVALGTPNGPDVFHTWGGGELKTYAEAGQVMDITELVAASDVGQNVSEAALASGTFDGSVYAVPVTVEASMVWYRTDIFEQLSLEEPTTWDEFLDVIATTKEAGLVPIAMANGARWPGTHWWSEVVAQTCGPDFVSRAAAGDARFDDPCVVQAHTHLQELVDAGAFNEGFNGLDYDSGESRRFFYSGEAAMNHMGNWTVSSAREESPEVLDKMAMFTLPAVPNGKVSNAAMTGGTNLFAISESAADADLAQKLLLELTGKVAAEDIAAGGRIPVYAGVTVDDPLLQEVVDAIAAAPALSPWPDQFLDPSVAEVLLTQSQGIFGKETTPEEAAAALQAAQEKVS